MRQVEKAIALGQQGFKIIPLTINGKIPLFKNYKNRASSHESDIIEMFQKKYMKDGDELFQEYTQPYNIGIITDDLCIIDIDNKNGMDGNGSYKKLFEGHELFRLRETNYTKTPNGGFHVYFKNPNGLFTRPSVNVVANGIDTKGYNNCITAPGSIIDGKEYEGVFNLDFNKLPVLPTALQNALKSKGKLVTYSEISDRAIKKINDDFNNFDSKEAIERAVKYLQNKEASGPGFHQVETYKTCCYLKDLGISQEMICELMSEHYADRCEPALDISRIEKCAESAYEYAGGTTGSKLASNDFNGIVLPDLDSNNEEGDNDMAGIEIPDIEEPVAVVTTIEHTEVKKPIFEFGNALSLDQIKPRNWIIKDLLLGGSLTVGSAAGSTGKTNMLLAIAAALAVGSDSVLGFDNIYKCKPVKSLIHSCEDDIEELSRRLNGYCIQYGLNFNDVAKNIALSSGKNNRLVFSSQDKSGLLKRGDDAINAIYSMCKSNEIGFIGLDPLANLHECNENDSVAMTYTMSIFNEIADKTGAGVLVMHHTSKSSDGSVNGSRGSSSINNSARIGFMINNLTEEEGKKLGIPEEDIPRISYIAEGKTNVSKKTGKKKWYYMESVKINNEFTGVQILYDILKIQEGIIDRDISCIEEAMLKNKVSMKKAIDILKIKPQHIKKQVKELQEYVYNIVGKSELLEYNDDYIYKVKLPAFETPVVEEVIEEVYVPEIPVIEDLVEATPVEEVKPVETTVSKPNLISRVNTTVVREDDMQMIPCEEYPCEEVTFNIPNFKF